MSEIPMNPPTREQVCPQKGATQSQPLYNQATRAPVSWRALQNFTPHSKEEERNVLPDFSAAKGAHKEVINRRATRFADSKQNAHFR